MGNSDDEAPSDNIRQIFDLFDENDQSFTEFERDDKIDNALEHERQISPAVCKSPRPRRLEFNSDELQSIDLSPKTPKSNKRTADFSPVILNQKRLKLFNELNVAVEGSTFKHCGTELTVMEKTIRTNLAIEFGNIIVPKKELNNSFSEPGADYTLPDLENFLESKLNFNQKIDDGSFQSSIFHATLSADIPVFIDGQIEHQDEIAEFEPIMIQIYSENLRDDFLFTENEYRPQLIFLVIKYYQIYNKIKYVGNQKFNLELPCGNFRQALAILTGVKTNAFLNHNDAEIICTICRSWTSVGQLMISLYCIAQRTRLAIIYPSINRDHPYNVRDAIDYMDETIKIQEWANIAIIANRKWGLTSSFSEQIATIKKTVEDKRVTTPYQRNLFVKNFRVFRLGVLIPEYLYDALDVDRILKSEMRTVNNLSSFFDGSFNAVLARRAFPGIFIDQLRRSVDDIKNENY
jgi:hypothetical protein